MTAAFEGRLLAEIAALNLPRPEDFVLNSSGALAERGVIPMEEVGDIDGSTTRANHTYLRTVLGWNVVHKEVGVSSDGSPISVEITQDNAKRFDIHFWDFSVYDYNQTGRGRISLEEQKACSEQDPATGIWVASLDYIERVKRDTGRPKDEQRLQAIRQFKNSQP